MTDDPIVVYEEYVTQLCIGDDALTSEQAKKLLGWQEEPENEDWGTDYSLMDFYRRKVRLHNNPRNRPLRLNTNVADLKQEIRNRRWRFNGEPIIIGCFGNVLNGQHSLVALVLLSQEYEESPEAFEEWDHAPTIEKTIVFGVSEEDEVVNTMDTCKPRSMSDILYRSQYFQDLSQKDRKSVAKACGYAINLIWERLGDSEAFSVRKTHSESLAFLDRHPRLVEAVVYVWNEENDESVSRYISVGYAAGLMYLMGVSTSDPEEYLRNACEDALDFHNWDLAEEFFVLLSSGSDELEPYREAVKKLVREEDGGLRKERICLLIEAWNDWLERLADKPKSKRGKIRSPKVKYEDTDFGKELVSDPSIGGIDLLRDEK